MPIVEKRKKEMKEEVSALYNKARTKEEYEEAINCSIRHSQTLASLKESSDTIVSTLLDGYWAEYYILLKFPATEGGKDAFVAMIRNLRYRVKDQDNYAQLLYLEAVTQSHLLHNKENADILNEEMQKMVLSRKVSVPLTLKWINSRVIDEMDAKNWEGAVEVACEIGQFSKEIIEQPENIGPATNIINNRGASKIRGDIDVKDGIKDLVVAMDYYLKQQPVPMKHIEGIKNRLTEATKKL